MNNIKLTLIATKSILTGFALLLLVLISTVIQLIQVTIKAIALAIKALNKWCDAQSGLLLLAHHQAIAIASSNALAMLPPAHMRILLTKPILPSSGLVIVPMTQNTVIAAKKRGRPKKLAIS